MGLITNKEEKAYIKICDAATTDELKKGVLLSQKSNLDSLDGFRVLDMRLIDAGLSFREAELLKLIYEGLGGKDIATVLGIGYGTVRSTTSRLYDKLLVHNTVQAAKKYIEIVGN